MIAGETSTRLLLGVQGAEVLERTRPDNALLTALSRGTPARRVFRVCIGLRQRDFEPKHACSAPALGIG